ncbi:hypothetical protein BpHYR1_018341 [Brachionus plicatilis]|uniref:PWWP domain-containing protein n=1 Tax=Brachionus plicatilis TaxID=10195 RepID=A0A3M7RAS2_BRAPC|nr:hypothetical protein BpHYR1_018341 [Brachionus plicatilis]
MLNKIKTRAKMKGYPCWPARITELVYRKSLNGSSSSKKKTPNEPKEYKVVFFGGNTTGSVFKDNIKPYDCEEKPEIISKYSKNPKMTRAIEEAEEYLKSFKAFDSKLNENKDKNLLSMDEELKLIKNAFDLKSENLNENSEKSIDESAKTKISSPLDSKKKLPIQIDKLCHKKEQRSSAIKAAKNISINSTPSQLKQQKEKISKLSGEDLDKLCSSAKKTYELIKSSSQTNQKSSKKRNRSMDESEKSTEISEKTEENSKKKCLNNEFESDDEELNFRIKSENKLDSTDFLFSHSSSPLDLSLEIDPSIADFKFSSMTLLIDSSLKIYKKYILKLFEIFNEMIVESNTPSSILIFDISAGDSDLKNAIELKLDEIKENCHSKTRLNVTYENELNKSTFETEIIFSFIKQPKNDNTKYKNYETFEKQLLSSEFNELKIVSFCPIDYGEVVIYHHHLNSSKGLFIEAPIIEIGDFSKTIIACLSEKFFKSLKHIFDGLFKPENVIFEGDELGYPSIFCESLQYYIPVLKLHKMVTNKVVNLIPQIMSIECIDKNSQDSEMVQIKNNQFINAFSYLKK